MSEAILTFVYTYYISSSKVMMSSTSGKVGFYWLLIPGLILQNYVLRPVAFNFTVIKGKEIYIGHGACW